MKKANFNLQVFLEYQRFFPIQFNRSHEYKLVLSRVHRKGFSANYFSVSFIRTQKYFVSQKKHKTSNPNGILSPPAIFP